MANTHLCSKDQLEDARQAWVLDPVLQVRVDGKMVTKELDPHLSGLYLMFGFIS